MCGVFERCKQGSYDEQGGATDPSTGPALTYLRQALLTCFAWPFLLCAVPGLTYLDRPAYVWCGASTGPGCLPSTGPGLCAVPGLTAYVRCFTFDRPRLRAVPGLTSYAWYPALLRQTPLCFASTGPGLTSTPPLMCSARGAYVRCGAVRCFAYFDRARGASTGPAYLLCALRCFAYFDSPWLCFDSPRLCLPSTAPAYVLCSALPSTPPGGALLALLCFALLTCFLHILRAVTLVVYMRKR